MFVHFSPSDHTQTNENDAKIREEEKKAPVKSGVVKSSIENMKQTFQKYSQTDKKREAGHESDNHDAESLKQHIDRARNFHEGQAEEEEEEEDKNEEKKEGKQAVDNFEPDGRTALHKAAIFGDLDEVEALLKDRPDSNLLNARDENGWQAIHEAARAGDVAVVKYLVDMGADISSKTSNGGTPLWWARRSFDASHPMIQYLEGIGAPDSDVEIEN